jgi:hypothetical protein
MRTIETNIYKYNELSNKAKEKAREWYLSVDHNNGSECIIDDAKEIASIIGIEIDKIYYTGFSNQGDGACFTGYYKYSEGGLKALKEHAAIDKELYRIGQALQDIQNKNFYGLSCKIEHKGNYYHENTMCIEGTDSNIPLSDESYNEAEENISKALKDFARWVYSNLEKQNDYNNLESTIEENIICNDYEFTSEGKIV